METPHEKFLKVQETSFKKFLAALVFGLSLTFSPINWDLSDDGKREGVFNILTARTAAAQDLLMS